MSRHAKTRAAIDARPTRGNLKWADIESYLRHVGADIAESGGSIIVVSLNGRKATFHRPHPSPDAKKYAIENVRDFLDEAGVNP